jgi:hypothetical protein
MTPGGWQEVACISTLYHESVRTHSAFGSGEALANQLLLVPCLSQPVALHSHRSTASCIELLNTPSMRRELMQDCSRSLREGQRVGPKQVSQAMLLSCAWGCSSPVRGEETNMTATATLSVVCYDTSTGKERDRESIRHLCVTTTKPTWYRRLGLVESIGTNLRN